MRRAPPPADGDRSGEGLAEHLDRVGEAARESNHRAVPDLGGLAPTNADHQLRMCGAHRSDDLVGRGDVPVDDDPETDGPRAGLAGRGDPRLHRDVRTQVDEIENELIEISKLNDNKTKSDIQRVHILKERISIFARKSALATLAMHNLGSNLGLKLNEKIKMTHSDLLEEIKVLDTNKDFQIYDKNIDHLSHMLATDIKSNAKKFRPSETEAGNISGNEFPAKVWALTFNNGPHKTFTPEVLQNLQNKNLTATFFLLGKQLSLANEEALLIKKAGMELGSHAFSHKELTKMGFVNIEKEIGLATKSMEEKLNMDIKFFRLPYGSGMEVPSIRQQIAKNNLIHAYWNIDTLDWLAQHPDRIVSRTKKLMEKTSRDSGIILFHDVHKRSVTASLEIMDFLKQDGRRTCTLGEIIEDMNQRRKSVCSQKSY